MSHELAQMAKEYPAWFAELKERINQARQKAALSVNSALIELYWELGKSIVAKDREAAWGSGFMERLSRDLCLEYPDFKGFSRRNLYAIKQWYLFYSADHSIVPQAVAQLVSG